MDLPWYYAVRHYRVIGCKLFFLFCWIWEQESRKQYGRLEGLKLEAKLLDFPTIDRYSAPIMGQLLLDSAFPKVIFHINASFCSGPTKDGI